MAMCSGRFWRLPWPSLLSDRVAPSRTQRWVGPHLGDLMAWHGRTWGLACVGEAPLASRTVPVQGLGWLLSRKVSEVLSPLFSNCFFPVIHLRGDTS